MPDTYPCQQRGRARPGRVDGGETWTACRVAVPDRDSSRTVVLDRATCARLLASVGLGRLRVRVRPGRPPAVVLLLAGRDVPLARHPLGLWARDGCRVRFRNGDRLDLRVANLDPLVRRG